MAEIIFIIIILAIAGIWLRGIFIIGWIGLKFIFSIVIFPIVLVYKIIRFLSGKKTD
jgi:hypothetical protein